MPRNRNAPWAAGAALTALVLACSAEQVPVGTTSRPVTWTEQQRLVPTGGIQPLGFGYSVAAEGETALVGAEADDTGRGAAYVFVRTGAAWTQVQKLVANDGAQQDNFGYSVAVSGDFAVVGAPNHGGTGAAYVFVRIGTTWELQQELAPDQTDVAEFGSSVILVDDTIVVGVPAYLGSAYVFVNDGFVWVQQARLAASDGTAGDHFGCSLSRSGDTAVIGALGAAGGGAAYVFRRSGATWAQEAKLSPPDDWVPGMYFGRAVAISGDTALIGGAREAAVTSSLFVFARSGSAWAVEAELLDSHAEEFDFFSESVALVGDTALVGAWGEESTRGSLYVFTRSGLTWTEQQRLVAADSTAWDAFGYSVALAGETAVVGAFCKGYAGGQCGEGAAYVFVLTDKAEGTPCTAGWQCASGACAAGRCVATPTDAGTDGPGPTDGARDDGLRPDDGGSPDLGAHDGPGAEATRVPRGCAYSASAAGQDSCWIWFPPAVVLAFLPARRRRDRSRDDGRARERAAGAAG